MSGDAVLCRGCRLEVTYPNAIAGGDVVGVQVVASICTEDYETKRFTNANKCVFKRGSCKSMNGQKSCRRTGLVDTTISVISHPVVRWDSGFECGTLTVGEHRGLQRLVF